MSAPSDMPMTAAPWAKKPAMQQQQQQQQQEEATSSSDSNNTVTPPPSPAYPVKMIKSIPDVELFKKTLAAKKIMSFIEGCCNSVKGIKRSAAPSLDNSPPFVQALSASLNTLQAWVDEIPLHDMKEQRFGNKAFRDLHARIDEKAIDVLIRPVLQAMGKDCCSPKTLISGTAMKMEDMEIELFGYLKDSFGNSTRIDFGTGHELHFFLFLMIVLEIAGVPKLSEAEQTPIIQSTIFNVFWQYLAFMRMIQKHYSLEPAGSHGVWGLDDYHHLPFIFGAAQLNGAENQTPTPILPKHITEKPIVEQHKDEYFYFAMIHWIHSNKKGPFFEHSSVLYNVSGIDEWDRIEKGMIKMFDGEVLSKYNIMQHLLFGAHIAFE